MISVQLIVCTPEDVGGVIDGGGSSVHPVNLPLLNQAPELRVGHLLQLVGPPRRANLCRTTVEHDEKATSSLCTRLSDDGKVLTPQQGIQCCYWLGKPHLAQLCAADFRNLGGVRHQHLGGVHLLPLFRIRCRPHSAGGSVHNACKWHQGCCLTVQTTRCPFPCLPRLPSATRLVVT